MKKIATAVLLLVLCFLFFLEPLGLAWMSDNGMSSLIDISGNVHKSYFAGGDGTEGDPFQIATPAQLYYFAWLQYLGLFNVDGEDEDTDIDTVYFVLTADLDMDYQTPAGEQIKYILPPIGTKAYPFLGNFDGQGHTVTDLVVENVYSDAMDAPVGAQGDDYTGVEIVGFFGVVGSLAGDTSYTYDSSVNEVKNVVLDNLTVKTQTDTALIGLIAGYVNGAVDAAGVIGSTLVIKDGTKVLTDGPTSNLSDYALLGYCTDAYKEQLHVLNLSLKNPGTTDKYEIVPEEQGEGGSGWGGSVTMESIYTWLSDVNQDESIANNNYTVARTDVVNLNEKKVTVDRTAGDLSKRGYTVDGFGTFVFSRRSNNYAQYNYVSGGQKVTQYAYSYTDADVAVYTISDGTNYLNFNGTAISTTTNATSATKWYASNGTNGGNVYTVVDGTVYYLTVANNAVTVTSQVTPDAATAWTITNGELRSGSQRLVYTNNTWQLLASTVTLYRISSGGNYLTHNGDTTITNKTTESDAVAWAISMSGNTATVSTVINGTTYYLRRNNSNLQLNTSNQNASWTRTASGTGYIFYMTVNNFMWSTDYYWRYNNGWLLDTNEDNASTITLTEVSVPGAAMDQSGTAEGIICTESSYIDNSLENGYYNADGNWVSTGAGITYFPLSTDVDVATNKFNINPNNTGYIVGAEWAAPLGNGEFEHNDDRESNLRISRYGSGSMTNKDTPYTMTYKTGGKFKTIEDQAEDTLKTLGLQKYASCYQTYIDSTENNCYGLHFMEASVTKNNVATITANLKGEEIKNYEVPTNAIDFHLYDRGFINFVAGTYFSGNNSCFSIYEITRDADNKIEDIKEISKIYAKLTDGEIDTTKAYYYTYVVNGQYDVDVRGEKTAKVADGYVEVFDCKWITHLNTSTYYGATDGPSAWVEKTDDNNDNGGRAYYFEVPVNAGEYAIGSTEGRTGAYLVYLDLAANAQLYERTKTYEEITEGDAAASLPTGRVDWLTTSPTTAAERQAILEAINPWNSAFVTLPPAASGSIDFDRLDAATVKQSATSGPLAGYVALGHTLLDGNDKAMTVPPTTQTVIERTTYQDYNLTSGTVVVTVIDKITVKEGATETITYLKTVTVTDSEGDVTGETSEEKPTELTPDTADPQKDDLPTAAVGADLISLAAIGKSAEKTLTVTTLYTPAVKDENGSVTAAATYDITVENTGTETANLQATLTAAGVASGITFSINGTALANNTNAQTVDIPVTATAP